VYLNQSIPLLFATPSVASSRRAIVSSLFLLGFAILSYFATEIFESLPFFMLMTLLIGIHGYVCLTTTAFNLLFIFRYFLVWVLIFGTAFVWFIYAGEVFVAPFGLKYQTIEYTRLLVLAGICSLCGSLVGWHVALLRFKSQQYPEFSIPNNYRNFFKNTGLYLAIGFALLYVWQAGGFIGGNKTYADGQQGFEFSFGVFNVFQFIGISLLLLASIRENRMGNGYLLISIFTLILGVLAGSRADYLPQAFIIVFLAFNRKITDILLKKQYMKLIKWFLLFLLFVFIGYLFATFVSIWRVGLSPWLAFDIMLANKNSLLINEAYGHKMFFFETGNMMLGSLYSAIVQVREGITGFLLGESYFNYFLIAPPAFLGLPRPLGLEWATDINGTIMTQGGIFEVAEAYWNFGLLGCFFVSLFISYFFGWLLQRGLKKNNYFYLVWYMVYGLHGFRSVWYQNFSYFRLMTIMLVIYMIALFLFRWFVMGRQKIMQFGDLDVLNTPK
jgi:hypothetical protein